MRLHLLFMILCLGWVQSSMAQRSCQARVLVLAGGHASPHLRPQIDSIVALHPVYAQAPQAMFKRHSPWLQQWLPQLYQDLAAGRMQAYHPDTLARKKSFAALQRNIQALSGSKQDMQAAFVRYTSIAFELHYRYLKKKNTVVQQLQGILLYAIDSTDDARNRPLLYLPKRVLRRYGIEQQLNKPSGVHYLLGIGMSRQPIRLAQRLEDAWVMEYGLGTGQWHKLANMQYGPQDVAQAVAYCIQSW